MEYHLLWNQLLYRWAAEAEVKGCSRYNFFKLHFQYHLQCRYVVEEIRQFTGYRMQAVCWAVSTASEFDAGGDESAQFISAYLSSHPKVGERYRKPWGRGDPICASGGRVAIQTETDVHHYVMGDFIRTDPWDLQQWNNHHNGMNNDIHLTIHDEQHKSIKPSALK